MPNVTRKLRTWVRECGARCRAAWRALRYGASPTLAPPSATRTAPPSNWHRVTREYPLGTVVGVISLGTGALARQAYETHSAERDGEWICYYRHNERCGAKTLVTP